MDHFLKEETHCFCLGISDYSDPLLHNLRAAKNNATDLVEILIKDHHFQLKNCSVTDKMESKETLRDLIKTTVLENKKLKNIIFYFAGHGAIDSEGRFAMVLNDTPLNDLYHKGLPPEYLNDSVFSEMRPLNFLIIIDCCFSQNAIKKFNQLSQYVIASSPIDEPSLYFEGVEYSVFTGALIDILEKGISNSKKELTIDDIYDELNDPQKNLYPQRERNGELGIIPLVKNIGCNNPHSSKFSEEDKENLILIYESLSKYKPTIAIETGISLEQKKSKVLNEFPYIISYHLKNIIPLDPLIKVSHLKEFFEHIIRLLNYSFLSQFFEIKKNRGQHLIGSSGDFFLNLEELNDVSLIDKLIPEFKAYKSEFDKKGGENNMKPIVFDEMEIWTNQLSSLLIESSVLFQDEQAGFNVLYKQIIYIVSQLSFLSKYSYISVRLIDVDFRKYSKHPRFLHDASALQGESLKPYNRVIELHSSNDNKNVQLLFDKPKYSNSVLLTGSDDLKLENYLNLWPFIIDCTAYHHRDDHLSDLPEIRLFYGKREDRFYFKAINLLNTSELKYFKEIDMIYSREELESHFRAFESQFA